MDLEDVRSIPPGAVLDTDICIVGSGPAGLTILGELASSVPRILVLESGGREQDPWSDALNEIESVGMPRVMDQNLVRNRVFGGSSSTWSGRTAVFDDMDFAPRSWVSHSGWPIRREEIVPYFARSMPHLGIEFADNTDVEAMWRAVGGQKQVPHFDQTVFRDYFWSYSKHERRRRGPMRFGPRALKEITPTHRCLINATVTHIDTNPEGNAVRGFEISGPDGQRREVRARLCVLCAGGIENARLLLASNRVVRGGVGNSEDQVGRYLMDHLRGIIGHFNPADHLLVQRLFNDYIVRAKDGGRVYVGFGAALAPDVQDAERLLNCAVWVNGDRRADHDPWVAMRSLLKRKGRVPLHLANLVSGISLMSESAKRYIVHGRNLLGKVDSLGLECIVEQAPNPNSRVTLSDRTDALGVPLSRIEWHFSDQEVRTVRRCGQLFAAELMRLNLPAVRLTTMIRDAGAPFHLPDVAHMTGTTRMGADPKSAVVDTNGEVFGVRGLYVAGSSVFPTSGHANPTQMIVALAVRLADHLKLRLKSVEDLPPSSPTVSHVRDVPEAVRPVDVRPIVLVTGASGKVGRKLTPLLVERGYAVRALTSRMRPSSNDGIDWWVRDLRQSDLDFSREVSGCVAVLHLGAELRHQADMARTNAEATGALARAAEAAGVRFMGYTSSISVYGSARSAESHEDSPVLTVERDVPAEYWSNDVLRAYGRTKLMGELAIKDAAQTVEYVIFRPTVIVDVADIESVIGWSTMRRALLSGRRTHHIYVLDVAEALVWAMERSLVRTQPKAGVTIYNLSDEASEKTTFAHILKQAYERIDPKPFKPVSQLPAADWIRQFLLFGHSLPLRRPLGSMSFPGNKLAADGYRHKYGMSVVRDIVYDKLRNTGDKHL